MPKAGCPLLLSGLARRCHSSLRLGGRCRPPSLEGAYASAQAAASCWRDHCRLQASRPADDLVPVRLSWHQQLARENLDVVTNLA